MYRFGYVNILIVEVIKNQFRFDNMFIQMDSVQYILFRVA